MRRLALGFLVCLAVAPAAAERRVALELVLLADATGSIDAAEIRFQREGYAEALTDPAVIAAIEHAGPVAITYVEWADHRSQDVVADWTVIETAADAARFAEALLPAPRRAFGRNAIGAALLAGKRLIEENGIASDRQVIDLSADSANNWNGPSIAEARAEVLAAGITINGLAVLCRICSGRPVTYDLERAFDERIVGGDGAFVVTADGSESFAQAVRRKLVLELVGDGGRAWARAHGVVRPPR
jgi:hypothetical protein